MPISLRTAFGRLILILLAALSGVGCRAPAPDATPQTFRVMSYNIHHGEGLDGKIDLERIAELIKSERADIVALQEVDKGVERTQRRNFPKELEKLTGMSCVFSNNFYHQGGEYGNAVLTRFPVKRWTNTHYKMIREGEQRGILQLVLDVRGREIVFMNTHIDYRSDDTERWSNMDEIEALAKKYSGKPIIICGDFNDTPGSRVHHRMKETFIDAWEEAGQGNGFTIPSTNPRSRIDYIWISKEGALLPLKVWVPRSDASDHLPVVGEFWFR